jgi:hypothetical protein
MRKSCFPESPSDPIARIDVSFEYSLGSFPNTHRKKLECSLQDEEEKKFLGRAKFVLEIVVWARSQPIDEFLTREAAQFIGGPVLL